MKERIYAKLTKELQPEFLEVQNNSALHRGHAGDNGTLETHFAIIIKSCQLSKLSRLQAHKKVNKIVAEEFTQGLHALEIKIL